VTTPVTIHLSAGEYEHLEAFAHTRGIPADEAIRVVISEAIEEEQRREDFRLIVREEKPKEKPVDYGPETRYGRESYRNGGYNAALDEYEAALLKRLENIAH
jgi:hypothetical protein